jgi:nucleoside-diphosphate-sugar epimerase
VRALVTGCAGFAGSHLTDGLLADGHSVVGVDCLTDNYASEQKLANVAQALDHDGFELRQVDLAEADLAPIVDGCDVVFHLAAEPGVRASWGARFDLYVRNNVTATVRLLDAVRAGAGTRFVYASSSSVYGDALSLPTPEDAAPRPVSPYAVTKLRAERLCERFGIRHGVHAVSLRYFSLYGPRQRPDMAFHRFCRAALETEPVTIYGDGRQTRDFTYVADAVAATRRAAERAPTGAVYNVGGGSAASLVDALALIAEIAGTAVDVEHAPPSPGDVRDTAADIRRARADLGYSPSVALEDGLAREVAWLAETSALASMR